MTKRVILAITGASGAIYGIRALEMLRTLSVETHLIISVAARRTIAHEMHMALESVAALATREYDPEDLEAPISSGSFLIHGMLIAPCSIKTLSSIATSYTAGLIPRAADVCLKEGRPLVLMVRETPLHLGHLRLMTQAAEVGAILFPPVPAFYGRPQTLDDMVNASVGRALSRMGIENSVFPKWGGTEIVKDET
jgi:flavin prenyltransferase